MLVGVDIVEIERIRVVARRTPRFLQRVFTARELEYCLAKADPFPSLAARFAAREAVRKLDPVFITSTAFHDTEVVVDGNGKPKILLHGGVLARAREAGIKDIALSLSHSREQAIAVVIADKE